MIASSCALSFICFMFWLLVKLARFGQEADAQHEARRERLRKLAQGADSATIERYTILRRIVAPAESEREAKARRTQRRRPRPRRRALAELDADSAMRSAESISQSASASASENELASESESDSDLCPICLAPFAVGAIVLALACGHFFHQSCALEWLKSRSKACPVCRVALDDKRASSSSLLTKELAERTEPV